MNIKKVIRTFEYDWFLSNYRPLRYILGCCTLSIGVYLLILGSPVLPPSVLQIFDTYFLANLAIIGGIGGIYRSSMFEILFFEKKVLLKKVIAKVSDLLNAIVLTTLCLGVIASGVNTLIVPLLITLSLSSLYVIYREFRCIS